jgi:hypothetical protein
MMGDGFLRRDLVSMDSLKSHRHVNMCHNQRSVSPLNISPKGSGNVLSQESILIPSVLSVTTAHPLEEMKNLSKLDLMSNPSFDLDREDQNQPRMYRSISPVNGSSYSQLVPPHPSLQRLSSSGVFVPFNSESHMQIKRNPSDLALISSSWYVFICYVYLLCLFVMFICYVYLLCLFVMFICYVYLLCLFIMFICYVYLLCLFVMFICYDYLL